MKIRLKTQSRGLMAVSFAVSACISLLVLTACNLWSYEMDQIRREEGDWHIRISQSLSSVQLDQLRAAAWTESVLSSEDAGGHPVTEIVFREPRNVYRTLRELEKLTGIDPDRIETNDLLLSRMLIYNPEDPSPPLLLPAYLAILILSLIALVLVLKTAVSIAFSSETRALGGLASVGASPKQIRKILIRNSFLDGLLPCLLGTAAGCLLSWITVEFTNLAFGSIAGRQKAVFWFPWPAVLLAFALCVLTVFLSSLIPAWKLSKKPVLELLKNGSLSLDVQKKGFSLLSLCGIHGEIAQGFLASQKHRLRLSRAALLLSYLAFSLMSCFTSLAFLSTEYTYFQRYQDVWDIRADLKGTAIQNFQQTDELKRLPGLASVCIYQIVKAQTSFDPAWQSRELHSLGGLNSLRSPEEPDSQAPVQVTVLVMDDASFARLAENSKENSAGDFSGALLLNRIWDSHSSSFREKKYIPFLDGSLFSSGPLEFSIAGNNSPEQAAVLPVSGEISEPPALREEFDNYDLVLICPLRLWEEKAAFLSETDAETRINATALDRTSQENLDILEQDILNILEGYDVSSENRIREKADNEMMQNGSNAILAFFCLLLAGAGLTGIFASTFGMVRGRRREFAQLQSLGMTDRDLTKVFLLEAFSTAGFPILITLGLTLIFIQAAAVLSVMDPGIFFRAAPWTAILSFGCFIFCSVLLASLLASRSLRKYDLSSILRDDSGF